MSLIIGLLISIVVLLLVIYLINLLPVENRVKQLLIILAVLLMLASFFGRQYGYWPMAI